jgi:hypothetical protein
VSRNKTAKVESRTIQGTSEARKFFMTAPIRLTGMLFARCRLRGGDGAHTAAINIAVRDHEAGRTEGTGDRVDEVIE